MFSTAIIIFREALEIAMILGVVLAATRGLPNRAAWVGLGLLGGTIGAALVAVFADAIANSLAGSGQEIFNAGVMFCAALFIGWTAIWVRRTAQAGVAEFKQAGKDAAEGRLPLYALSTIIGLSILREGAEIALFLYSSRISGQTVSEVVSGAAIGMVSGAAVGALVYFGMVKLPARFALAATSWLLVLLVAGLVAQGIGFVIAAGYLDGGLSHQAWNTSWLLTETSVMGKMLHGLVGYTACPAVAQVLGYLLVLGGMAGIILWLGRSTRRSTTMKPVLGMATGLVALSMVPHQAQALDTIDTPYVVQGEVGLEYSGSRTFDQEPERDAQVEHGLAVEYSPTSFMLVEAKAEYAREEDEDGDKKTELEAVELEARFQLVEPGQYWVDVGALVAYGMETHAQTPNAIEAKLLLAHDDGRLSHLANIGVGVDVGPYAESGNREYSLLWNTRYRLNGWLQPGLEYQGFSDKNVDQLHDQEHYLGPAVYGRFARHFNYQASFAWGLTEASTDMVARVMLEYEFYPSR